MKFNNASIRILVRKDYGTCFDFYKEKLGLVPDYADRNGPYSSFAVKKGEPSCIALFSAKNTELFKGYKQPNENPSSDTIAVILHSDDLDADYNRLKEAGVEFLGEPQYIEGWDMRCTYFRDPEGNLIELNDGGV